MGRLRPAISSIDPTHCAVFSGNALFERLCQTAIDDTEALLAPALRGHDGRWIADYVRLRFIATV